LSASPRGRAAIVFVGGFGSYWREYLPFVRVLEGVSGQEVFVAPISLVHWAVAFVRGLSITVKQLAHTVDEALLTTRMDKVVLIGHSVGGVIARLYLGQGSSQKGGIYVASEKVCGLITLGTPHKIATARLGLQREMYRVDSSYPGAHCSPRVNYLSVVGRKVFGRLLGSKEERNAYWHYRLLGGHGNVWGDGVVPIKAAMLPGSTALVIPGRSHKHLNDRGDDIAEDWYGKDEAAIREWWIRFENPVARDDQGCLILGADEGSAEHNVDID